jgi:thiol-disulfide isomerase/thioredoxin
MGECNRTLAAVTIGTFQEVISGSAQICNAGTTPAGPNRHSMHETGASGLQAENSIRTVAYHRRKFERRQRNRMIQKALLIFGLLLMAARFTGAASPATQPGQAVAPSFELRDADGSICKPLQVAKARGAKGVVFLFVGVDCPISNAYAPEINRICQAYGKADTGEKDGGKKEGAFDFYFVHADADLAPADAKKHAADYGYGCPVLMDSKKELAASLGAKVTPEAFVVSIDGSLLYHGRIDDRYVAYGKSRVEPTVRDLRVALDDIEAGKPVATPETKAIGCPI